MTQTAPKKSQATQVEQKERTSPGLRRRTSPQNDTGITNWVRLRFYLVSVLVSLGFVGVSYRAYDLQIRSQAHFQKLADRQHLQTVEVPAPRGVITDRNGEELAQNANVESVFANPRAISDLAATAERLSRALGKDVRELESRLASRRYFVWVKRHVTPQEAKLVRALDIPGVSLVEEPRRYYPGKRLAGHVLGFVGVDGTGLDGLELAMDDVLRGQQARMATLRDASGALMVDDPNAVPQPGASITLTLHRTVQFAAERALKEAVEKNHAKSAVAVVMDVANGEILALASYPELDPNAPGTSREQGSRNRALTDTYEIGSVMKVFTVATALEEGAVRTNTLIDTEKGRYRIGRKVFRDSFHDEWLDIGSIIKRSSNVGAVKIAQRVGAQALHAGFTSFGFGSLTGIELPGEQTGVLHDPKEKRWGELGLATHSFGYGMTSTPLQITAAMAAIGNKGVRVEPRVIRSIVDSEGRTLYAHTPKSQRVISDKTAQAILPMLESVFEGGKQHGTAHRLFVPGYRVGGKTGTAHKIDPTTRKYGEDLYLSSFSGLAPIDAPRIAVTVLIDEPHGEEHYGGKVAGPAWTRIVAETLPVLGIPADSTLLEEQMEAKRKLDRRYAWREGIDYDKLERDRIRNSVPLTRETLHDEPDESFSAPMDDASLAETQDLLLEGETEVVRIPDFTGLGIGKALQLAQKTGVILTTQGTGRAISQNPPPGLTRDLDSVTVIFTQSEHAFADR